MLRFSYFADVLPNSIHWFHYNIFEFLKMVWTGRDLKNLLVQTTPTIGRELSTVLWVAQSSTSLALSTFKDGASTISLENLFQVTILTMKNLFPMFKLNRPSLRVNPVPLLLSYKPL